MDEVSNWLENGGTDYVLGVELYLKHGKNKALRAMFSLEEETKFKRQKLFQVLKDLYEQSQAQCTRSTAVVNQVATQPLTAHKGWPNCTQDLVIQKLYDRWRPLYAELMNLQARVYDVALMAEKDDPNKQLEACQLAHRILDLDELLIGIYAERDYYLQHGRLPENKKYEAVIGDPVRWATELQNHQRAVRDYKLKLKNHPTHKFAAKWAQALKDKEALVDKYKKLLKLD